MLKKTILGLTASAALALFMPAFADDTAQMQGNMDQNATEAQQDHMKMADANTTETKKEATETRHEKKKHMREERKDKREHMREERKEKREHMKEEKKDEAKTQETH